MHLSKYHRSAFSKFRQFSCFCISYGRVFKPPAGISPVLPCSCEINHLSPQCFASRLINSTITLGPECGQNMGMLHFRCLNFCSKHSSNWIMSHNYTRLIIIHKRRLGFELATFVSKSGSFSNWATNGSPGPWHFDFDFGFSKSEMKMKMKMK